MTRYDQAAGERAVFTEFARACGLHIRFDSIESRPPHEPDIRCEVVGEGSVAFELGEVVSQELEQATNEGFNVRIQFRELYQTLAAEDRAAIEDCLGGPPAGFVGFRHDISPGRWRRAVKPILEMLVSKARSKEHGHRLREGDVRFWEIPALEELLTDLFVKRATDNKPFLGACEMTPAVDTTRLLLQKKFASRYESDAPMELLVYYLGQPPPSDAGWESEARALVNAELENSPFRRVWFYNGFTRAVALVCPAVDGRTTS